MKTYLQVEKLGHSLSENDNVLDPPELMVSISHVVGAIES